MADTVEPRRERRHAASFAWPPRIQ
jgi:hypothetical protein